MISILIPTLGRAHKIPRIINNIQENTLVDYEIIFVYELNDPTMTQYVAGAVFKDDRVHYVINYHKQNYAGAIQTGYNHSIGTSIFVGADDLHFHSGWDQEALKAMTASPQIKVVGTNDLYHTEHYVNSNGSSVSTHHLVARDYIESVGGVIDEGPASFLYLGYRHNFSDTEFIETAIKRTVFAPCPTSVVEHLHWLANKAQVDSTYEIGRQSFDVDRALYLSRQHLWLEESPAN